ncbi:helicase-exonuclease AddAB subunit AddA [Sedimentibacter sp.]|uniref:helicase-exonuclease AddAB subunit AddA n=1 Tax=Sedimentibacter sp. TaxID=1960295 RepID=UPI0028AA130C|nr:helicase-exonuclease AddAB subunit AddA [Sedimentibacter sp.]
MKFSPKQREVIDLRNKNILVSAAAGSGKTTVLVERIIKLITEEKENIDSFLIVTFTNAAASGMKQKIHKALIKRIQNSENRGHLNNQLNILSRASISTIHAFCIDVVRKNFHLIGIDPNFRIGDVNEVEILLNETIDDVLENYYASKSQGFIKLVESFTSNRGDSELAAIIKDIYRFILSNPEPFEWLKEKAEDYNLSVSDFKDSSWLKAIEANMNILLNGAEESLQGASNLCDEADGPLVYKETILEDLNNVIRLKEALCKDFQEFICKLHSVSFSSLKSLRGKQKDGVSLEKQEDVKQLREEYKKIINNMKKTIPNKTLDEFVSDINYMYQPIDTLYQLIFDIDREFKSRKIDKAIADFNDVEHYALQILKNKDVGERYRNKYKYIFIDEYQDSNRLQEELLNSIKRNNNLFMVGDVKQSIYRFRLADPTIFNEKCDRYPNSDDNGSDRRVDLTRNFRSRKEILNGINFIFNKIMNKEIGEVDYNKDVYLNPGAEFKESEDCFTELTIIDKNKDEADDISEEILEMKQAELEAALSVQKIRELLQKNNNFPINRKDNNEITETVPEKLQYKDIVILMRSVSNSAGIFEEVFNNEGIPFYFDGGIGYYETIEIQIILNLLRIIDNIRQDVPLLSVMRSTIGSFTTEELVDIRVNSPKCSFIDALYNYKNKFNDELSVKLRLFTEKIELWKKRSRYTHLNDFIWEVLMETNYYYFVGLLPNGKIRQANLRLLTDKAYDFEKTAMSGLFNFLRYVEKLKASSGDSGSAKTLGENDNVVRLMSVHKSKGLEFPVVILCGLSKRFNKTDTSKPILKHRDYGLAPKYINPDDRIYRETIARTSLKGVIKIENLSEEMRVLYVAMTRAVDRLIMIGTVDKVENKAKKWNKGTSLYNVYNSDSYLDWICSCFNNGSDVWQVNTISLWQINLNKQETDNNKAKRIQSIYEFKNQNNSLLKDEIDRRLKYKYEFINSVNVPAKLSVTDIKVLKNETIERVKYKIPVLRDIPQFNDEVDFTKAEIGTIVHFVMQHLDLKKIISKETISEQINEMVQKKLLTEKEAAVVDIKKLMDFFKSDIGVRMMASVLVKREVPFVIKKNANEIISALNENDTILIQGIIDCYFYEDDEVVIIDYKTDEINSDDDLKFATEEYRPQILSYKEAVEKITRRKVKACYLYLFDAAAQVEII